ncbi:MAG: outer membrane lipoprotein carrier protein LolA [Candidatus Hydrothermota bacterium]|nr:MAG: outer membrane lipoprotein carrier protein LolA [Candidatus Hydrothermae bacterium]
MNIPILLALIALSPQKSIIDRLSALKTFKADFYELITYNTGAVSDTWRGKIYFKNPDKLRLEVKLPDKQLIISDGKEVWLYFKKKNEAYKRDVTTLVKEVSPSYIFMDTTKCTVELDTLTETNALFTLKPKNPKGALVIVEGIQMSVSLEDTLPDRVVIRDKEGNSFDFHFTKRKANKKLKDKLFQFKPPKNCKVYD